MLNSRAERQLILISAGTAARRRTWGSQAARLAGETDWDRLAATLRARKLLPTLGPRIVELAGEVCAESFRADLAQALEAGRRHGVFLQLTALRIQAGLADAGIASAPLKGPLLGEAIYGDPGRRLSSDIDLLVAPAQLSGAVQLVRGLGYGAPLDYVQASGLPLLHFVLAHEQGTLPIVELHWRIHWYEQDFAVERLLPPIPAPAGDWRPDRVDELIALLLFYARDGFADLRLATDLGAWWDLYGSELQAGEVAARLASHPALARAVLAAAAAAERVVGLPSAEVVDGDLRVDLRGRLAAELANPNPRVSQAQLYADMGLIDGLLAPPGGLRRFVRRQLLPPREVLSEQARKGAKRRARSPLGRCAGMLARYSVAMTRAVRGPETLP